MRRILLLALALLVAGCYGPPTPAPIPPPGDKPALVPVHAIDMLSQQEGWALTALGVLRTENGGRTWSNVTPPGFSPPTVPRGFFLTADTGWVAGQDFAGADQRLQTPIFRTTDGGRTWQSTVVGGSQIKQITFLDQHQGWLMLSDGAATGGSELVRLLHTGDGGQTWNVTAQSGISGAPLRNFPLAGMKSGVTFADAERGWAAGGYTNVSTLFFHRTEDGGATWTVQQLPIPERLQQNPDRPSLFRTRPPWLFPDGRMVLQLTGFCGEAGCTLFLHSGDTGRSWQATAPLQHELGVPPQAFFLDPEHGWAAAGERVLASKDGGQTWAGLATLAGVQQLDFVTPTAGWAVANEQLWQTTDGGRTWRQAGITLARP